MTANRPMSFTSPTQMAKGLVCLRPLISYILLTASAELLQQWFTLKYIYSMMKLIEAKRRTLRVRREIWRCEETYQASQAKP